LAGEASAAFSLLLGRVATFDCRISQLPNLGLVVDYFRWRNEDAARNALTAYCYWTLRNQGLDARAAETRIVGMSVPLKNELLFELGINFNNVANWQKRGVGLYWETYTKSTQNRMTNEPVVVQRRRIKREMELPMKDDYNQFLIELLQ
jgi:tRNA(His) 5'-end guanylyltransferase